MKKILNFFFPTASIIVFIVLVLFLMIAAELEELPDVMFSVFIIFIIPLDVLLWAGKKIIFWYKKSKKAEGFDNINTTRANSYDNTDKSSILSENTTNDQIFPKVTLSLIAGKEFFGLGVLTSKIQMIGCGNNRVTFGKNPDIFQILEYSWSGPKYQTLSTSYDNTRMKEKDSAKKANATLSGNTLSTDREIEENTIASLKLKNTNNGQTIVISFTCNTKINAKIQCFNVSGTECIAKDSVPEKNSIALLKEYKELLDLGIITSEEFERKKKELL